MSYKKALESGRKRWAKVDFQGKKHKQGLIDQITNYMLVGTYVRPHRHNHYEFFELLEGRADLILYHEDGTIKATISLKKGEPLVTEMSDIHSLIVKSGKVKVRLTMLHPKKIDRKHYFPEWSSENPRALITGAGFIASHLIRYFLENTGWDIVILDRLNFASTPLRWDFSNKYKKRLKFVYWDLKAPLNDYVKKELGNVDYVFHLAANSDVTDSINRPVECFKDNLMGTVNLLEYFRHNPVRLFNYFSTDESFGPAFDEEYDFKEGDRHNPGSPYASSKAGAEDACSGFANTYGIPIIQTNTMNVIGQMQDKNKFLPLVVRHCLSGEELVLHGDEKGRPSQRYYIHAIEVSKKLHFIVDNTSEVLDIKDHTSGKFNIVGEKELDNVTFAKIISKYVGKKLNFRIGDAPNRPGNDHRYSESPKKLIKLGYKSKKSQLEEDIEKTVKWYLGEGRKWL